MSREVTLRDNAVRERFMCTFKKHKINENNILEAIINKMIKNKTPKIYSHRSIVKKYVNRANKKSNKISLKTYDKNAKTASLLMFEPK